MAELKRYAYRAYPGIWAASVFIHNGAPQALVEAVAGSKTPLVRAAARRYAAIPARATFLGIRVYPRRAERNTIAEGGNRRWAESFGC